MSANKPLNRRQFLRGLTLGLGVAATPAILGACGTQTPTESNSGAPGSAATTAPASGAATAPAVAATSAPAANTQAVTVTWWDPFVTQEPWIQQEVELFQQANPGITINRIKQPKMDDALTAAFTDKSLPDLWIGGSTDTKKLVNEGWLYAISDFADYKDFVATFPNPAIDFAEDSNMFAGKTYGAPFEARTAMWNALFANTKLLKDAGIVDGSGNAKIPQTLDEMTAAAKAVTEKGGGQSYGFAAAMSEFNGAFWPWWWGFRSGAPFDGLDGETGKSIYGQNPVFNRILEFFVQARDEGFIHPQSATANDEAIRALFAEGQAAFIPNGQWAIAGWQQTHPEFADYVPFAPPLIGTDRQQGFYRSGPGGSFMRMSANTQQAEAAWNVFKWVHSKEAGQRWVQTGNGSSIFPENNDVQYMGSPALQEYFKINTENSRVGPMIPKPSPDMAKVTFGDTKPNEVAIIQGVFAGQITDIDAALKELGAAKDAMREQAFADAKAAGAQNVGFENFAWKKVYPDWDPSAPTDYVGA